MKTSIYIPRRLMFEDFTISEDDACTVAECIVVLAEPGAGKTRLLLSLAEKLGSKSFRANVFRRDRRTFQQDILIIDGLDEVAKIDCSAIEEVFCRVGELAPKRVIFASRSSEWDEARNRGLINDFIGLQPKIVRLLAFDEVEQRSLFKALFPDEDFFAFQTQAERFELAPLLGNPLFLDLFAKAYVENNRVFESKERIFSDAIRSLAEEHNSNIPNQKARPDTSDLVLAAEDIFAKLLLSGASGVAVIEAESDRNFPYLLGISKANKNILKYLLDTNLFKLADTPSLNEPVHRIVAEYCAANYLAKRIRNSHDHLTLRRCLSVIAPNGVVRTELRGLLGWLAALGDEATQLAAIDLDPYAILANGDSVLLSSTSKTRLLFCLKKLEVTDPYFRHSDKWRQFNVKDFFTKNIVEETKQLLSVEYGSGHLRGLLLELLTGSSAVNEFEKELEEIVYNEMNSVNIRELSNTNLLYIIPRDHKITFRVLLHQGGNDALMLASRIVTQLSVEYIGRDLVGELFLSLQYLYPKEDNTRYNVAGSHYFIKQLIESISLSNVIWLLDLLSQHLKCSCEAKYHHQCHCRNGISKIVGYLLDRYFSLEPTEICPVKIWKWIRNVNFHSSISQDLSYSVKYLLENSELRHAIHILAFEEVNGFDDVWALRCQFSGHYMHSGLFLNLSDARKIVDYAFSNDNIILWRVFFQHHDIRRKDKDDFRANMRIQSNEKPEFMRVWAMNNLNNKRMQNKYNIPLARSTRRWKQKRNKGIEKDLEHLKANREQIESGKHWGWLKLFSYYYLNESDKFSLYVDDPVLPEKALINCIPFIYDEIPSLSILAKLQCQGKSSEVLQVLYSACLAIFRTYGVLSGLNKSILFALKTNVDMYSSSISTEEVESFEEEINRCIFINENDSEDFARNYIEPQISIGGEHYTNVDWLRYKPEFYSIKNKFPLEWLTKYQDMPISALKSLFSLSLEFGDHKLLNNLICQRCNEIDYDLMEFCGPLTVKQINYRYFWYVRSFIFIKNDNDFVWDFLKQNPDTIFELERVSSRFERDGKSYWPSLDASQCYKILSAFTECWPKVALPDHWGTGSPKGENAYRYLKEIVWLIEKDSSLDSISIINELLSDNKFIAFHDELKHIKVNVERKVVLQAFEVPSPQDIVNLLDENRIASVEDMRALLCEMFTDLQSWLSGGETDLLNVYYDNGKRVNENYARNRIVDFLKPLLNPLDINVIIERHMANSNRCDFTAEVSIDGVQKTLVIEVKGQWHAELYNAASKQLYERYSIHPNAAEQGIYLVLWFGCDEKIAGKKMHGIMTPNELKNKIISMMPQELVNRVDVFVLDLSK